MVCNSAFLTSEDAHFTSSSPSTLVLLGEEWDWVLPRALLRVFSVLSAAVRISEAGEEI